MKNYLVKICSCGVIHFIDEQMLENIYEKDGSLLHICNNCNVTSLMWGEPSENGISIVSRFVTNETLDTKEYNIE